MKAALVIHHTQAQEIRAALRDARRIVPIRVSITVKTDRSGRGLRGRCYFANPPYITVKVPASIAAATFHYRRWRFSGYAALVAIFAHELTHAKQCIEKRPGAETEANIAGVQAACALLPEVQNAAPHHGSATEDPCAST